MIELIEEGKSYDLTHPSGAVFKMASWTFGMQEELDRKCFINDGKGGFNWDAIMERRLKISQALLDWNGVCVGGQDVPCTAENKMKLPVGIIYWLIKEIDERAGFRMTDTEKKISI